MARSHPSSPGWSSRNTRPARFGWALPLTSAAELEFTGENRPHTIIELYHDVRFGEKATSPAEFEVRCIRRFWQADEFRHQLANQGISAVARGHQDYYENHFGPLRQKGAVQVRDDLEVNEITTVEAFELLEPWRRSQDGKTFSFGTLDEFIRREFQVPRTSERRSPI